MNIKHTIRKSLPLCLVVGVGIVSSPSYGDQDSDDLTEKKQCVSHQVKLCVGPDQKCPSTTHSTCNESLW